MLREYAIVILDPNDNIIDRYNIDIATKSTNNGFQLNVSTISSNLEDIITSVSQKKLQVKFTVEQIDNSYTKANLFAKWLQRYSKPEYIMALEYKDGDLNRYCIGKVINLSKDERTYPNVLKQNCTFQQTSPWFLLKSNVLIFEESPTGKSYSYKYPYSYGSAKAENNELQSTYIYDLPLNILIDGAITNPKIYLTETNENGEVISGNYSEVNFEDLSINNSQQIFINSKARKIYLYTYQDATKTNLISTEDITHLTDPLHETFLFIKEGYSKIFHSQDYTDENFKVTGSWREYLL